MLSGPGARPSSWPGAEVDADAAPLGARLRRALAAGADLVAIDGANVIDPRLIGFLLRSARPAVAARGEGAGRAVALRLEPAQADAIPADATDLRAVADALVAAGRIAPVDEAAFPAYVDKLRRSLPYWLHVVADGATRKRLERQMFWENYKGSTDLLTRWVYPPIVWPLVLLCTRLRIHPNVVTLVSIVFTIAAVPLFARGDWIAGFLCAYAMSVLDSVDGKVARLTLTDSKIGNVLDHGIDQVHPPFWYFAWAWGLGARTPGRSALPGRALADLLLLRRPDRARHRQAPPRLRAARRDPARRPGAQLDRAAQHHDDDHGVRAAARPGPGRLLDRHRLAGPDVRLACRPYDLARIHFAQRAPGGLMSGVEVIAVSTPAEMDRFIKLPYALYAADPNFVPPLLLEREEALSPKKNPYFQHAEAKFWLARRGGRDVGRISAQIDRLVKDPEIGHFGMLVAEDRPEVFAALFAAAEGWLRERGKKRVLGPFNLSINEETGLLVDGFDTPPMLLMGHDPRYAGAAHRGPRLRQDQGRRSPTSADTAGDLPASVQRFIEKRLPGTMTVRQLDTKRYEEEFDTVTEIFNDAWSLNWGFIPFTEAEIAHMAKSLKPLHRPGLRCHRRARRPRRSASASPCRTSTRLIADFKGRLLPFNWIKLLLAAEARRAHGARAADGHPAQLQRRPDRRARAAAHHRRDPQGASRQGREAGRDVVDPRGQPADAAHDRSARRASPTRPTASTRSASRG